MVITKHFCGKCTKGFATESAYLKHVCPSTGFSPAEPKHFDLAYKETPEKELPRENIVYLSEEKILKALTKTRRKK